MADIAPVAVIGRADGVDERTALLTKKRDTVVMVRWALIIACAYFILFSDAIRETSVLGMLIIAVFLGSNLWLGRLPVEQVAHQQFNLGVAALDSLFIAASLFCAGQLSVELLVLCLGILTLAIAGLRLGTIAAVTLGMTFVYFGMVWLAGVEPLWRSSTLLRVPFLLGAALLYASLVEGAQGGSEASRTNLGIDLATQLEAIQRAHAALASGSEAAAHKALDDISTINRQMRAKLDGQPLPSPAIETQRAANAA